MRILTVQQPAAGAIAGLGKLIENRTWPTSYRGPIAIHAGARAMPEGHPFLEFPPYLAALAAATAAQRDWIDHRGVVVAIADLVDVHEASPAGCCAPWGESHIWTVHWVLANVRPLTTPFALRGALGLRNLDPDIAARLDPQEASA